MPAPRPTQAEALGDLIDEVRSTFHRLKALAREVHGGTDLTAARRGVMRDLLIQGKLTVPALARMRPVSRQHIQIVVNGLVKEGWVTLVPNPAHKRSRLVSLTPTGRRVIRQMLERETNLLGAVDLRHPPEDLLRAARVLRDTREDLDRLRP